MSLAEIATATKISPAALEALERNDYSRLPGGIFSRSFVRAVRVGGRARSRGDHQRVPGRADQERARGGTRRARAPARDQPGRLRVSRAPAQGDSHAANRAAGRGRRGRERAAVQAWLWFRCAPRASSRRRKLRASCRRRQPRPVSPQVTLPRLLRLPRRRSRLRRPLTIVSPWSSFSPPTPGCVSSADGSVVLSRIVKAGRSSSSRRSTKWNSIPATQAGSRGRSTANPPNCSEKSGSRQKAKITRENFGTFLQTH